MKVQGVVEASDERGVKLDGRWYKYVRHVEKETLKPEEGAEVELEVRKGLVQRLKVLNSTNGVNSNVRPHVLRGFTELVDTNYGKLYVTVNTADGKPFEVMARTGKADDWAAAYCETIGRLISLTLRSGVGVERLIEEIDLMNNRYFVSHADRVVISISDAIAGILKKNFSDETQSESGSSHHGEVCPNCNAEESLVFQGGCSACYSCGFMECY